ncbi:MAG TPA: hypothetical protein VFS73_05955 [Solirubrobacterales bacterium]|nr:hypothetical protein [Solirubrobacterales bacterium]
MPPGSTERDDRLARIILVVAMAVSAATLLVGGRHLTFWSDELTWLLFADDFTPAHLLTPHNSHLIATTRLIYEALPRVFGTDYLPFRIIGIACLQANALLLFHLVRRRLGAAIALVPAVVLLFFGSAQDVAVSPLGIPFLLSIALGLGAFAAVERRTLGGDAGAMLLLVLAILSHTFGTIVAIGVAVYYALERGRRRELWVPLVPLALWVAWWIWARHFDQGITEGSNIAGTPLFVVEAAGATLRGILGFAPDWPLAGAVWILFDVAAVAGAALLIVRAVARGATPWLWAYAVTLLAFWTGLGLSEGPERGPAIPRYLLFGAIMVVLVVAEAFRGADLNLRVRRAIVLAGAVCLVGNVVMMARTISALTDQAKDVRAQIGIVSSGPDVPDPGLSISDLGPPASAQIVAPIGPLLSFEREYGPLGYSADELRAQADAVRLGADFVLIRALGIGAGEIPAGQALKTSGCVTRRPAADGYTTFELSPGLNVVRLERDPGAAGATLDLGRFADVPDVEIGTLRAGRRNVIVLPGDGLAEPWRARTTGTIAACRAGAAP